MSEPMTGMVKMFAPNHISSVSAKGVEFKIVDGCVEVPSDVVKEMRHHGLKTEDELEVLKAEAAEAAKESKAK